MSPNGRKNIVVIGGGVIGLTTAIALSRTHQVKIISKRFGVRTESAKAVAIWQFHLVPETETIFRWAETTLKKLIAIHTEFPEAGVELIKGVELFRKQSKKVPVWSDILPLFEMLSDKEISRYNTYDQFVMADNKLALSAGRPVTWGFRLQTPAVCMKVYLDWLMGRAAEKNVELECDTVRDLTGAARHYDYLINCTGLGARELTEDNGFVPQKEQYFVLQADDDAPLEYIRDREFPTGIAYVITRGGEVIVGGSIEEGIEDFAPVMNWNSIAKRTGVYVPWLRTRLTYPSCPIVVCVSPARVTGVRLETESVQHGGTIIHNYGHGGSGVSLSWGCAEEVGKLIKA
jgi:D-amino-acid oxidase